MTATLTLADFLTARIAEDEEWARIYGCPDEHVNTDPRPGCLTRVLAECDAKRRVIELRYSWNLQAEAAPAPIAPILRAQVLAADAILRTLALSYADHEDFQEAWRA